MVIMQAVVSNLLLRSLQVFISGIAVFMLGEAISYHALHLSATVFVKEIKTFIFEQNTKCGFRLSSFLHHVCVQDIFLTHLAQLPNAKAW